MIVDDHGAPLPAGQSGLHRRLVPHPGCGLSAITGELVVPGRVDDMLSVGGMKAALGPVVERIKAIDGILDAMIASVVDRSGCEALLVALEIASDAASPDLQSQISAVIQHYASAYQLLLLSAFPAPRRARYVRRTFGRLIGLSSASIDRDLRTRPVPRAEQARRCVRGGAPAATLRTTGNPRNATNRPGRRGSVGWRATGGRHAGTPMRSWGLTSCS
jgi:hypothetical protein